jgi:chromosome segregation ATPase
MDMASALEIHLNTSERNRECPRNSFNWHLLRFKYFFPRAVRKARTQLQETNKERESAQAEAARSRKQLEEAQKEVSSVRNSIIVEKRSLEDRLSEERRAKERAKAQLEQRLNEMTQQSHSSKFKVSRSSRIRQP